MDWFKAGQTLLCAVFAAIAACTAAKALADAGLRFEMAGGQCRYERSPDGMWWQKDQENASQYKDNGCGEIGIAGKLNPTYGWSLRYVNLGRAHTRALAVTCPNDDCALRNNSLDFRRPECLNSFNGDNCQYQWNGDGGIKGLNFALSTEMVKLGRVSVEGEIGVLLYQMKWNEQVFPLGCDDGACPWRVTVDQKTGYYLSPMGGLTAKLALTPNSSLFMGTRLYLRTSQHVPIASGVQGYVQCWMAGIQTSF